MSTTAPPWERGEETVLHLEHLFSWGPRPWFPLTQPFTLMLEMPVPATLSCQCGRQAARTPPSASPRGSAMASSSAGGDFELWPFSCRPLSRSGMGTVCNYQDQSESWAIPQPWGCSGNAFIPLKQRQALVSALLLPDPLALSASCGRTRKGLERVKR